MKVKANCLPAVPPKLALSIIFISSLCCINSWNGSFVFDDSPAILNNPDVSLTALPPSSLSSSSSSKSLIKILKNLVRNDFWGNKLTHKQSHRSYRPFTVLTFIFQRWLRGSLNPIDFHIFNLILHTSACMLFYHLLRKLLDKSARHLAFYIATLFAVHPIHCEAVAGIVGRADILCAIFVWLSVLFYSRCIYEKNLIILIKNLLMCILCITYAMLCKEIGITAIGICYAYDLTIVNKKNIYDIIIILKKESIKNIIEKNKYKCLVRIVLFITCGLLLAIRFNLMGYSAPSFQPVDNPSSFINNIFMRHINYQYIWSLNLWLLICPQWLSFDWSMGCVPIINSFELRLLSVILLWLIFGVFFIKYFLTKKIYRDTRYVSLGLCMLIIPFLPASNLFFTVGFVLAERTLYLPSAGYCFIVVMGLQKLSRRFYRSRMPLIMYTVLVITWFTRSWMRSDQWKNEHSLFRSGLSVCPLNAKVHYNVAKNAADSGNTTLAEAEYLEALRLNPQYAQAMNNLGNLLNNQKRYQEAKDLLKKAVGLQPDFAAAWMNLGIVLAALKQFEESKRCYETSLSHRRHCPDCHYNLGLLYLEQKNYTKALEAWTETLRQDTNHRRAWINTIRILDDMGKQEKALREGEKATKLLPDDATIRLNIANILGKLERFEKAEAEFKRAAALDPTNPTIFTNLGVLYHRWNKLDKAKEMYTKALEINPNAQSAKNNMKKLENLIRKKNLKGL
ncbi:protein O-mannosyl-transferase TMTC4 [Microplitis demolitor]|uniref:protein O-mannosyl-transferase TMTC4 n=1 Tax=Microplitis demolitor TaxID=69319 RepID=UPI00235B6BE7|nr:protein O-mannosyl-transferase TMTC4 [Microplitis demolitor]